MRLFLFVAVGHNAFTVHAENKRAARVYGLELLGYPPGSNGPRCRAVPVI